MSISVLSPNSGISAKIAWPKSSRTKEDSRTSEAPIDIRGSRVPAKDPQVESLRKLAAGATPKEKGDHKSKPSLRQRLSKLGSDLAERTVSSIGLGAIGTLISGSAALATSMIDLIEPGGPPVAAILAVAGGLVTVATASMDPEPKTRLPIALAGAAITTAATIGAAAGLTGVALVTGVATMAGMALYNQH